MFNSDYAFENNISQFMYRVYGWMSVALVITAAVAYYISTQPSITMAIYSKPALLIGIFIAQIALVLALSFFLTRLNVATALALFLLYAASVGVTTSAIFLVYDIHSIYVTFLVTSATFATMCLYGYFTRSDLTSLGNIAFMALIGLIIAGLVNLYFQSPMANLIISGFGVLIFTALTAYDSQKIKQMGYHMIADRESMHKVAIFGALTLYLDFINLFLFLLNFLGKRKD